MKNKIILKVVNLVKKYNEKTAVNGISFEMKKGEIFALLGPNGAGKTSTLKCIVGLRKKNGGDIFLNGSFAYLPENKDLYKDMKIRQIIEFTEQITKGFDKNKAFELVDKFKLDLNEKIANLSHGMLTQVYMILTIAQDADIYILDEPTWGLDPLMRRNVIEMIRTLTYNEKSVLYTSHILSEVEKLADEVAIMNHGRIIEMDALDNLKEKYGAISVSKKDTQKINGYLLKENEEELIYVVKRDEYSNASSISFEDIFEAIVKGGKER